MQLIDRIDIQSNVFYYTQEMIKLSHILQRGIAVGEQVKSAADNTELGAAIGGGAGALAGAGAGTLAGNAMLDNANSTKFKGLIKSKHALLPGDIKPKDIANKVRGFFGNTLGGRLGSGEEVANTLMSAAKKVNKWDARLARAARSNPKMALAAMIGSGALAMGGAGSGLGALIGSKQ